MLPSDSFYAFVQCGVVNEERPETLRRYGALDCL